ncbi:hypothetical protein [Actinoplanes solisilvae]|uniref:hypothetical protein n=1 Tax=Actinoplanes solisilvae TaxID=2486853 RepID=UPI001F0B9480|nr:hypothetical protein [Actinoplanes solisilvae]
MRVITADRRPYRAAATATFVALPPRNFAKVLTSRSETPICCGYRSTPMRPIVNTSSAGMRGPPVDVFAEDRGDEGARKRTEVPCRYGA